MYLDYRRNLYDCHADFWYNNLEWRKIVSEEIFYYNHDFAFWYATS